MKRGKQEREQRHCSECGLRLITLGMLEDICPHCDARENTWREGQPTKREGSQTPSAQLLNVPWTEVQIGEAFYWDTRAVELDFPRLKIADDTYERPAWQHIQRLVVTMTEGDREVKVYVSRRTQ